MKPRPLTLAALALLTLLALGMRLPMLGLRPFHGDEAVHALKFRDLWEHGVYRYDANEFHGPTIYYAALPSVWLHGRQSFASTTESDYRLPIALLGGLMLLFLWPLADGLGQRAVLWAGLLLAISPAFVFYSRYFIQELPFAAFTLGTLAFMWRYARAGRSSWLIGAGICLGLVVASKETALFTLAAGVAAWGLTLAWGRAVDGERLAWRPLAGRRPLGVALGSALLTAVLIISGFGTNLRGPVDYLRSYLPWLGRAGGTNLHRHAFDYYLHILVRWHTGKGPVWNELLIVLLALGGLAVALAPRRLALPEGSVVLARFIAFTTALLLLVYSVVPYKTPWCILSPLLGMILLAGIGASALVARVRFAPVAWAAGIGVVAAAGHLGMLAYQASFVEETNPSNPYVYAQPIPNVLRMVDQIQGITRTSPEGNTTVLKIVWVDPYYWPLPWYLRAYPNIGYRMSPNELPGESPADKDTPILIVSPEFDDAMSAKLNPTHIMPHMFSLRPGVFMELFVRMEAWERYLKLRPKPKDDE